MGDENMMADYFRDTELIEDPYPYYEQLRAHGPVVPVPAYNTVAVVGFAEGLAVHRDSQHFSAVNSVTGPIPPLPFEPKGEDITAQIEAHRASMPFGDELLTQDPPRHSQLRSLLTQLFTPRRLRAMETHLTELADRLLDEIAETGRLEVVADYAAPYALLAIADLLGVPDKDRAEFRKMIGARPAQVDGDMTAPLINPFEFRKARFLEYIEERRRHPREDVLSDLANVQYSDGATPDTIDIVRAASILFGAGQDTTATLIGSMLRLLAERPDIQKQLRQNTELISPFIEEVLRTFGPVKATFRLARTHATIGNVQVAPGTTVMLMTGAMNRDPRHFEAPAEFRIQRPTRQDHLAFGRGPHTCPGAALARAEARISLERILARLPDIRIDEKIHGPPEDRHFRYLPSYVFRTVAELHLRYGPS